MEETLIPQIRKHYVNLKWRNSKCGYFEFQKWKTTPNIKLYFHEFKYFTMDDGKECQNDTYPTGQWEKNKENHIVAVGFIAFCLYWIQSKYNNQPYIDLFDTYFVNLRDIYIAEKKTHRKYRKITNDEFFNYMFFTQHIIEEKQRIEDSQTLFGYLTPQDKATILTYIDDYFEHIEKSKPDIGNTKSKLFNDYLYHENKPALILKLHELLDNTKGKQVAIVIKALQSLNYIAGYSSKSILYSSMRKEFGEIGSDSGLNDFLNPNGNKLSDSDISTCVEILKAVK